MTAEPLREELSDERSDADILAEIEQVHGSVTPEIVVKESERADHEWHGRFEWNDSLAAHRYRLDQARALIRSVRIEIEYSSLIIKPPVWVHDPAADSNEQGYTRLLNLRRAKKQRAELMRQEVVRAVGNLRRAYQIALGIGEQEMAVQITTALSALGFDD